MIRESELILNHDRSVFHLHLKPEDIAENIILVGDQGRVDTVAEFFDSLDLTVQNREFKTATGWYNKKRVSVISTGIGTDNIDIVLNELDALANIDFNQRKIKDRKKSLRIIRIGTSGGLQSDIPVNTWILSQKSIGFDGMLPFYANWEKFCDMPLQEAFMQFTGWKKSLPLPYVANASEELMKKFSGQEFRKGITISAPGFYGPQGRVLRLNLAMPELNQLLEKFRYGKLTITNFEMESSAIYGLSKMMGHQALTICLIIANRVNRSANENYHPEMKKLIKKVLAYFTN